MRDVQIAARHADPRTRMRYDRARKNLDRHPNYILAALHGLRNMTVARDFADDSKLHVSHPPTVDGRDATVWR